MVEEMDADVAADCTRASRAWGLLMMTVGYEEVVRDDRWEGMKGDVEFYAPARRESLAYAKKMGIACPYV